MRPTSQHSAALFGQPAPDFTFDLTPEVKVKLLTGDIRQQAADAIVNPCNDTMLQGLSAVSRSIFEVAGKDLRAECEQFLQMKGRLDLAEVMHTTAGWYTERTDTLDTPQPSNPKLPDETVYTYWGCHHTLTLASRIPVNFGPEFRIPVNLITWIRNIYWYTYTGRKTLKTDCSLNSVGKHACFQYVPKYYLNRVRMHNLAYMFYAQPTHYLMPPNPPWYINELFILHISKFLYVFIGRICSLFQVTLVRRSALLCTWMDPNGVNVILIGPHTCWFARTLTVSCTQTNYGYTLCQHP